MMSSHQTTNAIRSIDGSIDRCVNFGCPARNFSDIHILSNPVPVLIVKFRYELS